MKIVAVEGNERLLTAANSGSITVLVVIAAAWLLSVLATMYNPDGHVLSLIIGSMGIPGLVVSVSIGLQAIK